VWEAISARTKADILRSLLCSTSKFMGNKASFLLPAKVAPLASGKTENDNKKAQPSLVHQSSLMTQGIRHQGSKMIRGLTRRGSLNIKLPKVRRANTGEKHFLGVALQFDNNKEKPPAGCDKCTCGKQFNLGVLEESNEFRVFEFIQEEKKKVTSYHPDHGRSGPTKRSGKFTGPWFHAHSDEMPLDLKRLKLLDGQKWAEDWHVTRWIKFNDPYTHQRSRFRFWRRVAEKKE